MEEDIKLLNLVEKTNSNWNQIQRLFSERNIKSIKERYMNYLNPNLKKTRWTLDEDMILIK